MNAADFAAMSDPERNPKFSRRWEEAFSATVAETPQRPLPTVGKAVPLDALVVLVSEDWRSARVVREAQHG